MELLPSQLEDGYPSLDDIMQAINSFAFLQGYAIVKRRTKTSKKEIVRKVVLMCDHSKVYTTEHWCKRDTSTRKTNCPFDVVAIIQDGKWRFSIRNGNHNHKATLPGAHLTHRKAARIEEVLEQITNHARIGAPPQQTFTHLRLGQNPENPLFKNRDIYNERERLRQ